MTMVMQHPDLNRLIGGRFGKFRAIVTGNNDPERMGRIRVTIPSIYNDETVESGWALPCGVSHIFRIPSVGEMVWVEFEEGDIERVVWQYGGIVRKQGINQIDSHTQGTYRSEDNGGGRVSESFGQAYAGEYRNVETWNNNGNIIEVDSTDGQERILIQHKSGTRVEILPDGTMQCFTAGNKIERVKHNEQKIVYGQLETRAERITEYASQNKYAVVDGSLTNTVRGGTTNTFGKVDTTASAMKERVTGSKTTTVGGDLSESVMGNHNEMIMGALNIIVANYLASANPATASVNIHNTLGTVQLKSGVGIVGGGIDTNQITMDNFANILVQAIARAVITAPVIQLGASQATAINNVAKALPLVEWLSAHTHVSAVAGSPTTPPTIIPGIPNTPLETIAVLTPLITSPTVLVD